MKSREEKLLRQSTLSKKRKQKKEEMNANYFTCFAAIVMIFSLAAFFS